MAQVIIWSHFKSIHKCYEWKKTVSRKNENTLKKKQECYCTMHDADTQIARKSQWCFLPLMRLCRVFNAFSTYFCFISCASSMITLKKYHGLECTISCLKLTYLHLYVLQLTATHNNTHFMSFPMLTGFSESRDTSPLLN